MLESQNELKLLTKNILFLSSKRIAKVIEKTNIIEIENIRNNIRSYCKIKITKIALNKTISKWLYMNNKNYNTKEKIKII